MTVSIAVGGYFLDFQNLKAEQIDIKGAQANIKDEQKKIRDEQAVIKQELLANRKVTCLLAYNLKAFSKEQHVKHCIK